MASSRVKVIDITFGKNPSTRSKIIKRDRNVDGDNSSPVTGLEWPRGFQEVKVPRFRDNGTGWW